MVQLAALGASIIARVRPLGSNDVQMLVACGAAAGISAAYSAPIAAAFFVSEVVLGIVAAERVGLLIISAVLANLTMRALPGYHVAYDIVVASDFSVIHLLGFVVLGLVAGSLTPLYLGTLRGTRSLAQRIPISLPLLVALGGFVVGAMSILEPAVLGNGRAIVEALFGNRLSWQAAALMLFAKIASTAISTGSGAVGGIFTPTLAVGGALGFLLSSIVSGPDPSLFVLVGMGAFLAATTQAPLMSILMMFEFCLHPEAIVPLMLGVGPAYVVSRLLVRKPMYAATERVNHSAIAASASRSVRAGELATAAEQVATWDETVDALRKRFAGRPIKYVFLVDAMGAYRGAISLASIHDVSITSPTVVVSALSDRIVSVPCIRADTPLADCLQDLAAHDGERLPVCNEVGHSLIGFISKSAVLAQLERLI